MIVVLKRVLPSELKVRGVKDSEGICSAIAGRIAGAASGAGGKESFVEEIFRRLGGS